eukprot:TRINITY_DN6510_c0_g1_i1.p1 TRINITY_DN6510_c0_g1~~TRINITY_DN6510_c0_g1_i1.p1  ORF type:complete len:482 (-),score=66.76 TRINITY_DN6510_c0_g1_i1:94-1539(-)
MAAKKNLPSCDECHKTFANNHCLKMHKLIHKGEKPFSCDICHQQFRRIETLKRHKLTHSGNRPFTCYVCFKSFTLKKNLTVHVKLHTDPSIYTCQVCKKTFNKKGNLERHKRSHTGDKPFSCGECEKSFVERHQLERHVLCHFNDKPFSCAECGLKFKRIESLKNHEKIHNNKDVFSCDICEKKFPRKCQYDIHMRKHTGVRPFSCDFCDKTFAYRGELNRHMKYHNNEYDLQCKTCKKTFANTSNLKKHMDKLICVSPKSPAKCDNLNPSEEEERMEYEWDIGYVYMSPDKENVENEKAVNRQASSDQYSFQQKNLARQPFKSSPKSCNHVDGASGAAAADSHIADKVQRQMENIRILREIMGNLNDTEISTFIVDTGDGNVDGDTSGEYIEERGAPITWTETHREHYYKCPVEKCDIIVSEKDFETGLAVKHMARVHKMSQRRMENNGMKWRKLSVLQDSFDKEADTKAPDNSEVVVED